MFYLLYLTHEAMAAAKATNVEIEDWNWSSNKSVPLFPNWAMFTPTWKRSRRVRKTNNDCKYVSLYANDKRKMCKERSVTSEQRTSDAGVRCAYKRVSDDSAHPYTHVHTHTKHLSTHQTIQNQSVVPPTPHTLISINVTKTSRHTHTHTHTHTSRSWLRKNIVEVRSRYHIPRVPYTYNSLMLPLISEP